MITLNIYYTKKENQLESELISDKGSTFNLDNARQIVMNYMRQSYPDTKYKLTLITDFNGNTNLNIYLEDDVSIKREYLLKNILDGN